MSVVFETIFLMAALQAFIYATIEARRVHKAVEAETDVWFWVQVSTVLAAFLPFVHLLQVVCHSNVCPAAGPLLPRIELLLVLVVMIFTFTTVYHVKKAAAAGNYPF